MTMPTIPDLLNAIMARDRLTQSQLAERLGASTMSVQRWLNGTKPQARHEGVIRSLAAGDTKESDSRYYEMPRHAPYTYDQYRSLIARVRDLRGMYDPAIGLDYDASNVRYQRIQELGVDLTSEQGHVLEESLTIAGRVQWPCAACGGTGAGDNADDMLGTCDVCNGSGIEFADNVYRR